MIYHTRIYVLNTFSSSSDEMKNHKIQKEEGRTWKFFGKKIDWEDSMY
jgi:hypothetical protein